MHAFNADSDCFGKRLCDLVISALYYIQSKGIISRDVNVFTFLKKIVSLKTTTKNQKQNDRFKKRSSF